MVDVNAEILQALSSRNFGVDMPEGIRTASGLTGEPNGICRTLYSKEFNACFEELKTLLGGRTSNFPGINGSYWQAADNAAFEITGDIDVRLELVSITGTGGNAVYVSRWAASPNQVWEWRRSVGGADQFFWSTVGTDTSAIITMGVMRPGAHRIVLDVNDGVGNRILTHSTAATLSGPFGQYDQDTVAGVTSIYGGSNSPLRVGARADASGLSPFLGRISRVQLRNTAGTLVADFDVRFLAPGTTTFVDSVGITWNAFGTVSIV